MKRTIRLTESDLHRVIMESVNRIIKEDLDGEHNRKDSRFLRQGWYGYNGNNGVKQAFDTIRQYIESNYSFWKTNPRIDQKYVTSIFTKLKDLEKMIDPDSPLATAAINQTANPWSNNGKPSYGFKPTNEKGQIMAFNPLTRKMEPTNNRRAINLLRQMYKAYEQNPEQFENDGWYVDDYGLCHADGGVSVSRKELESGRIDKPVDKLIALTRDMQQEPTDWYELNDKGYFDQF